MVSAPTITDPKVEEKKAPVFDAQAAYNMCVGATRHITTEAKLNAIMALVSKEKPRYVVLGYPTKKASHFANLRIYPKGDEKNSKDQEASI